LQVDAVPIPAGVDNPHGNGFKAQETDLLTTSAAQRLADPFKARIWKVKNPAVTNPISGAPVAYKIMMSAAPTLLAQPDSVIATRGVFASRNLWVTPYADDQKFPAGDYVLQSSECQGLSKWTAKVRAGCPDGNMFSGVCQLAEQCV
jgi:primary-amine oxidase